MLQNFINKKLNELAPEKLYKPTQETLVIDYKAPNSEEIKHLENLLSKNKDFTALKSEHKNEFTQFIFDLERSIPILNSDGRFVKGNIRLVVCREIAKALFYRRKKIPKGLKAIVLEPTSMFITKHSDAYGIAASTGVKNLMAPIEDIHSMFKNLAFNFL